MIVADSFDGMTAVVNLSDTHDNVPNLEAYLYTHWSMGRDVDEAAFDGLIRFITTLLRGKGFKVLVIGHQDTIDVVATCVLREYLGCTPEVALGIMRIDRPQCMTRSELLETVFSYKIT
jgi:hypothetical protein